MLYQARETEAARLIALLKMAESGMEVLFLCLPACLPACLSVYYLSVCTCVCVCLSIHTSVFLFIS